MFKYPGSNIRGSVMGSLVLMLALVAAESSVAQSLMILPSGQREKAPVVQPAPQAQAVPGSGAVCAAGRTGGAYELACNQVVKHLGLSNSGPNSSGVSLQIRSFGGSQANLDELTTDSSPVVLAAVQLNDLLSKEVQIGKNELEKKATRLGSIGKECAYMLTATDGIVGDLDDLSDESGTLYIVGKGANSIWRALVRVYPKDLEKITVVTEQPGAAGKALETADAVQSVLNAGTAARAMLIVQLNNFSFSPDAQQMISQVEAGKLSLIKLGGWPWGKFSDSIPGLGKPFTVEEGMLLKKGMFTKDVSVTTVCTESVMVYNPGKVAADKALSAAFSVLKANPQVVKVEAAK